MNVEIKNLEERRVATLRHVGPYNQIGKAFERLSAIAGPAGLFNGPDVAIVGLYHDDAKVTPAEKLRSDAGVIVGRNAIIPAGLSEQLIPAGRYACTLHEGSYERLGGAWARFRDEWLPASGHRAGTGPSFELYLNTPMNAAEADLKTELSIPLA